MEFFNLFPLSRIGFSLKELVGHYVLFTLSGLIQFQQINCIRFVAYYKKSYKIIFMYWNLNMNTKIINN